MKWENRENGKERFCVKWEKKAGEAAARQGERGRTTGEVKCIEGVHGGGAARRKMQGTEKMTDCGNS